MSRIFCLVGKSGSGKDTLYRAILDRRGDGLVPVIPCTTRPMREGEADGVTYFFVTDGELRDLEARGQVVEKRVYQTVHGPWTYFTRRFDLAEGRDYILITTLEGVWSLLAAFGPGAVRPVYLDLPDGLRLHRCLDREEAGTSPDYEEMCRRFLADQRDFAPEKLAAIPGLRRLDASGDVEAELEQWERIYRDI